MRFLLTLTAVIVTALAVGQTAQAHLVAKADPKHDSLNEIERSQEKNLAHSRYVCKHGARKHKRWACKAIRWLGRELHQTKSREAKQSFFSGRPPHYAQWLCIHDHEGAWDDPNAPYYGGLQMDWSFMRAYGGELLARKGTADNWTPLEQMWVAERAHRSRGFSPWPNTARYCGLL